MNKTQAIEDLQFIKKILSDSRRLFFDDGIIHIIWAISAISGTLATYTFYFMNLEQFTGILWITIMLISVLLTIYIKKTKHSEKPANFAGKIYAATWKSIGLGIVLFVIGTIPLQANQLSLRLSVIPLMLGVAYFISAQLGIYKWMHYVAVGWWITTACILFTPNFYSPAVLAGATSLLELLPGIILLIKDRRGEKGNE